MGKTNGLREQAKEFIERNPITKHAGIGTPVKPFILIEDNGDGTLSINADRVSPLQGAQMCHQAEGKMIETLNLYMFSEAKKIEETLAAIGSPGPPQEGDSQAENAAEAVVAETDAELPAPVRSFTTV